MAEPNYRQMAREAARRYGIDPDIFERQIEVESGYAPDVISGQRRSSAGARGIAQLMPVHWQNVNPDDPAAALDYAARLMRSHLDRYGGDYRLALAAYNAGPGNVDRYGLAGVTADDFAGGETKRYLAQILPAGKGQVGLASPDLSTGGGGNVAVDPTKMSDEELLRWFIASNSSSTTQIRQGADGRTYIIDTQTGTATPVEGMPGTESKAPPMELRQGTDGRYYVIDPVTKSATPIAGMPGEPTVQIKRTVPSQFDPEGTGNPLGTMEITEDVPLSVAKQIRDFQKDANAAPEMRTFPDGSLRQWNPDRQTWELVAAAPPKTPSAAELQAQAMQRKEELARRLARGEITPQEAITSLDEWITLNYDIPMKQQQQAMQQRQFAHNVGMDRARLAMDTLPYRVGPSFGADFSKALNTLSSGGGPVSFSPDAFTFPMPDFNAMAEQGAAQALAWLSPTAAQIAGQPMPRIPDVDLNAAIPPYGGK